MILKRQIIVISLIFGAIALILIFLLTLPFLKGIKNNSLELISAKKELLLFQDKTGEMDKLRANYDKIEPDLKKIEEIFIDLEMPVDLIEFLEKTAYDLELLINISPVSQGFRLTLDGSFVNFQKFLEKIEKGPYLIKTKDLSVKSSDFESESGPGDVTANLTIELYVKKD